MFSHTIFLIYLKLSSIPIHNSEFGSGIIFNSLPLVFCKKVVLTNFAKLLEKHQCRVSFLISCRLKACNFIKQGISAQLFSCEFCKNLRTVFFIEHLRWRLLCFVIWLFFTCLSFMFVEDIILMTSESKCLTIPVLETVGSSDCVVIFWQ